MTSLHQIYILWVLISDVILKGVICSDLRSCLLPPPFAFQMLLHLSLSNYRPLLLTPLLKNILTPKVSLFCLQALTLPFVKLFDLDLNWTS